MAFSVTVGVKALGRRKPLLADWSVDLPPDVRAGEPLTLRDVITRIVAAEVEAFRTRQRENQFVRVLTARQIAEGVARGKVDSGGRPFAQEVDAEQAIGAALQAFEDGLYLVVLDGVEQRDLDAQVYLHPESRLTFVRLVMLAGGF